jgi:hypothetical protein
LQSDSYVSDKEKFRLLPEEVQSLLLKRVIEEIPLTQSTPGFYSRVVPDKSEKFFWKPKKLGYGNKHPKGPVWWSTYLKEYKL